MLDYFQTGAFLGTSKETTLRVVLQDNIVRDIRINDFTLRGSDTVQSLLTLCAASILSRGVLVDLRVGIGLTNVPKYTAILSSTYRFRSAGVLGDRTRRRRSRSGDR